VLAAATAHLLENGQEMFMYTSSFSYNPEDRVQFSETDEKRKCVTCYTIEKTGDKSRLTMDFYLPKNLLQQLYFKIRERRAMEQRLRRSLGKLEPIVEQMVLPLEF
jgi:hypothetical protein